MHCRIVFDGKYAAFTLPKKSRGETPFRQINGNRTDAVSSQGIYWRRKSPAYEKTSNGRAYAAQITPPRGVLDETLEKIKAFRPSGWKGHAQTILGMKRWEESDRKKKFAGNFIGEVRYSCEEIGKLLVSRRENRLAAELMLKGAEISDSKGWWEVSEELKLKAAHIFKSLGDNAKAFEIALGRAMEHLRDSTIYDYEVTGMLRDLIPLLERLAPGQRRSAANKVIRMLERHAYTMERFGEREGYSEGVKGTMRAFVNIAQN